MRIKKARKILLPHGRCGHYGAHAPHVWDMFVTGFGGFARPTRAYCNGESLDPPGSVRSASFNPTTPLPTPSVNAPSPQAPAAGAPLLRVIHESGPALDDLRDASMPLVVEMPAEIINAFDVSFTPDMQVKVNGLRVARHDCGSHTDHGHHVWRGGDRSWRLCHGWPESLDPPIGENGVLIIPEELGLYPEGRPTGVLGTLPADEPLHTAPGGWCAPVSPLYDGLRLDEAERSDHDAWVLLEQAHAIIRNRADRENALQRHHRDPRLWAWCLEYDRLREREGAR